jgi:DMSO reductase family type II enzyme molybdopterin subunit
VDETPKTPPLALHRRDFLRLGAGAGLSLAFLRIGADAGTASAAGDGGLPAPAHRPASTPAYDAWEDVYRSEWRWDRVSWGSHTNQCFPGGCSFRVFSRDGIVWREEQTASTDSVGPAYPDFNPQGCQKGCGFHHALASPDRVLHPLRRVGERGEGRWQRISWEEALTTVADAILDAHEKSGPQSVVVDAPHIHAGSVALSGIHRLAWVLGALVTDLNVAIGDDLKGIFHTFGTMQLGYSADNFIDAELIVLTNSNLSYTGPPMYHFLSEARYNGSEIVLLAPDYNPTALVSDVHVPLRPGTDAAFWLAVCQVLVSEGLVDADFVREQTDLPLLVRSDTGRYLRASEVDGGREDQLYFFDEVSNAIARAPRGTLHFEGRPALDGRYRVRLADAGEVEVRPVMALLREKLDREHTPERASATSGVGAELIRSLARKIARKRTCCYIGFTSAKQFHGDLHERSLLLAMALTGNWGKPGTGFNCFLVPIEHVAVMMKLEYPVSRGGLLPLFLEALKIKAELWWKDPEITDALVQAELMSRETKRLGVVPPVFFFYHHAGYAKLWDRKEWSDPSVPRSFGEAIRESVSRGWWDSQQARPGPETPPKVLVLMAHNPLRRERSGRSLYVEELFPKLDLILAIETRMSSSAAFADIVLPAAWYYEKEDTTITFGMNRAMALIQEAVPPRGEAKPEWEIFAALSRKITERARERGLSWYRDASGEERRYADAGDRFTIGGHLETHPDVVREYMAITDAVGLFGPDAGYEAIVERGQLPFASLGRGTSTRTATEIEPGKPYVSLRWHVERGEPYATYARRAQFYIDHEWYLEAGEALPTYKEIPPIGGRHPFRLVSGHIRGSIHSMHIAVPEFLRLHRGQPVLFVNDRIAKERGVADGDTVRLFNDVDAAELMVSTSAAVPPDQVVVYMWESFQFAGWRSHDALLVGMPKSLHLAGGYGQLRHVLASGTPTPASDRGLRVDFVKIGDAPRAAETRT